MKKNNIYIPRHTHVTHLLLIWFFYGFVLFVLPVESNADNFLLFQLYQFACVVLTLFLYFIMYEIFIKNSSPLKSYNNFKIDLKFDIKRVSRIFYWGCVLSVISTLFILFDKIHYQNIDFSRGMAAAHAQWSYSKSATRPHGVSSIFSVVGYLTSCTYYVSSVMLLLFWEKMRFFRKVYWCIIVSFIILLETYVSGGRSIVILFVSFMLGFCIFRCSVGMKLTPFRKDTLFILAFTFILILCLFFKLRIALYHNGTNPMSYAQSFINMFQAHPIQSFYNFNPNSIIYILFLVGSYFVNSAWILPAAMNNHGVNIGFSYKIITFFLLKAHLITSSNMDFPFPGTNLSFFGGFLYDFGLIGMFLSIAFMSFFMLLIAFVLRKKNISIFGVCVVGCCYSILILSPIMNTMNIMMFPYVITSLILMRLIFGPLISEKIIFY